MTLGDAITHALPELRIEALSTMRDRARISRPGADTFDPNTGLVTPGAGTTVYEGPCRLRAPGSVEAEALFGEQQVTMSRFILTCPHTVVGVRVDDVVEMLETDDADAADRTYRVVLVPAGSDLVLKAFGVEAVE